MLYEERRLYAMTHRDGDGVGKGTKSVIILIVLLVHGIVGVLPLVLIFTAPPPDKVYVDKVVLVDSEPNDNTIPSLFPGKNPEPNNEGLPPPPPELESIPELPDPVPEALPPSPPKVEPVVSTKIPPEPVAKPDPKAPAIKKVKEQKKQQVKKQERKKPKISREEQIRRWMEAQLKKRPQKSTRPPQKTARTSTDNSRNRSLQEIADSLRGMSGGVKGGTGTKAAGGAGGPMGIYDPARANIMQAYWQRISRFLQSRWVNKPNLNALGGQRPKVRVIFKVTGTGVITSAQMQPSGVAVMDSSVSGLLRNIRQLPAPPGGKPLEFWVDLEVE